MTRRSADVLEKVPLVLIAATIKREITMAGEELHHIVVKKAMQDFSTIVVHTRSLKRVLRAGVQQAGAPAGSAA